jgi:hypothetical protein
MTFNEFLADHIEERSRMTKEGKVAERKAIASKIFTIGSDDPTLHYLAVQSKQVQKEAWEMLKSHPLTEPERKVLKTYIR